MKQSKYLGGLVAALLLSALPAFAGGPAVGGKYGQSIGNVPVTQDDSAREESAYRLGTEAYSFGQPRVLEHQAKGAPSATQELSIGKQGKGSTSLGKGKLGLKGGGESSIADQGETEEVVSEQSSIGSQGFEEQGEESVALEQSVSDQEQNPLQFFEQMNQALTEKPPSAEHQGLMDSLKQIGVGPGQKFNPDQLDVPTRKGLTRAVEEGQGQFTSEQDSNVGQQ
jgi:hypothetical protein